MATTTKTKKTFFDIPIEQPTKNSVVTNKVNKSSTNQPTLDLKVRQTPIDLKDIPDDVIKQAKSKLQNINQKLTQMGIEPEKDINVSVTNKNMDSSKSSSEGHIKPKIENLPAIISQNLEKYNYNINPEWTMVKDLPGYMKGAIRAFGREIMKTLAPGTPLEKIQVITTLGSLNSINELNAVASFLKNYGIRDNEKSGKIIDLLPGYSPNVAVFRAFGYNWLLVEDFAGKYIYAGVDPNPPIVKNQTPDSKTITKEMRKFIDLIK